MQTVEWHFLLKVLEVSLGNIPSNTELETDIDWQHLLKLSQIHRVRPLLWKGLNNLQIHIPNPQKNQLHQTNFYLSTRNLLLTKELLKILMLLKEKNVDVIPLKGIVLSQLAYGDVGLREIDDIDLLIHLEDYPKIEEVLISQNYQVDIRIPSFIVRQYFKHNCEFHFVQFAGGRRKFLVEPHWFLGHKMLQIDISYTDVLPMVNERSFINNTINQLSAEGLLITTCIHHGAKEQWLSLKYLCDVAAIINQFNQSIDWKNLLDIAHKLNIRNILLLGLGLTKELLNVDMPPEVETLLQKKKIKRHIKRSRTLIQFKKSNKMSVNFFWNRLKYHLLLRERWITKISLVYYHIVYFLLPNANDIGSKELSRIGYYTLILKKPMRMWKRMQN